MLHGVNAPFDTFWGTLGRLFGLSERNRQKWFFVLAILCLLAFPMVIDGLSQILFPYESNAYMRIVTGFLYGIAQGGGDYRVDIMDIVEPLGV